MNQPSGKLVLLGASEVGKSCIALRFVRNTFTEGQPATLGAAFLTQVVNVGATQFKFEIWDTAGQERFASIAPMYYRGTQFAIIAYDVSDANSFERAKNWVQEVKQKSMANTIIALCGNKCDLPKETWQVDTDSAQKYASMNQLVFYETSAKDNKNITEVFTSLAEAYIKQNQVHKEEPVKIKVDDAKVNSKSGCC
ncbi:Rab2a [Hexamita inflata]|uniref:Rab2a n=1 Tax=Hexamita inflata TaxID=28002 RepID=A0AA86NG81_9EUKA|nr:Rab2a [Hexamita inflata]CAI9967594.1 Rab2a [Hexamita inflata]CAI9971614.1 Rab2a [Hexamita inflata]CAI9973994.1 Rab2a [Hexamita inflata]